MKPGDMIEWVYKHKNNVVPTYECLFSSTMDGWVPIGAPAMLVMVTKEAYMWLTPEGLFHACVDDARAGGAGGSDWVIPRRVNL